METVAALLEQYRVDYVLIGGYALQAHGITRATTDIDIVVRNSPANNAGWIAALGHLPDGATKVLEGDAEPFRTDDGATEEPGTIRVLDEFVVDVMPAACALTYEDLEPFIGRVEGNGNAINVLNLDGLLLTKRGVRPKDQGDRVLIERALAMQRQRKR